MASETQIYFNYYKGEGHDFFDLNPEAAKGFLEATDLRSNVMIVPRTYLRSDKGNNGTKVEKQHSAWYIGINDSEISREVVKKFGQRNFGLTFTSAFRRELVKGLKECSWRENILNGRNSPDKVVLASHASLVTQLVSLLAINLQLISSKENLIDPNASALSFFFAFNLITNTLVKLNADIGRAFDNEKKSSPFIRKTFLAAALPPVRVDRLIAGEVYLWQHGHELLSTRSSGS